MKNIYLLVMSLFFIFSCNENTENKEETNTETDTNVVELVKKELAIAKVDDTKYPLGFYMINISATANVDEAMSKVQELQKKGHPAGYLWLPDYESLSDKELYAVFIGPFDGKDSCVKYLVEYQKEVPKAYAIKVNHEKNRFVIHNKFDFRINNKKQYMILTYATPEDQEEYAEGGGEDWAWFVNDVANYFTKFHKDQIYFGSVYYSYFDEKDISQLVNELDLEGFGYVLIKGNEKDFIPHDMPDGVISEACEFFGFEFKEDWQE